MLTCIIFAVASVTSVLRWRHEWSLLTLCEGNLSVNGGFSHKERVMHSFYIFFHVNLNKLLNNQLSGSRVITLWCHIRFKPRSSYSWCLQPIHLGPLARYVKLRAAHAPGMPGTFSMPPRVSDPDMHHATCVTHVPWCIPGSLTSSFIWIRWRRKRSRHSRRMRKPQFYVSGKRSIVQLAAPGARPSEGTVLTIKCAMFSSSSYWYISLPMYFSFVTFLSLQSLLSWVLSTSISHQTWSLLFLYRCKNCGWHFIDGHLHNLAACLTFERYREEHSSVTTVEYTEPIHY